MKITYDIKKKRGNFRPVLTVHYSFEDWEKELNVQEVGIKTPFPSNSKHGGYFDGFMNEKRSECDNPKTWIRFKGFTLATDSDGFETILPWRAGAKPKYKDVGIILKALQRKYEAALKEAYDSAPFEESGTLEMSSDCKKHVAPGIAAKKMLKVVNAK